MNADNSQGAVTVQLRKAAEGDLTAQNEVFRLIETDVRQIARRYLRQESKAQSMQTTMLVDDAFLRFLGNPESIDIADQRHFFRLITRYVKQLLIDAARLRNAQKRGSGKAPLSIRDEDALRDGDAEANLRLSEALERLDQSRKPAAEIFELHQILGMDFERVSELVGMSVKEVEGLHRFASAWLQRELGDAS